MADFHLKIITPYGTCFDDMAQCIVVSSNDGEIAIMANHINYAVGIKTSPLKIKENGKVHLASVTDGFITVKNNEVFIITNSLEWAEDIDIERAKLAERRARELLELKLSDDQIKHANVKLQRAVNRISVYNKNNVNIK